MIGSSQINSPLVLLSAGGTGGHVFPAEALAKVLSDRGCRLMLVTDRRGSNLGGRLGELETHLIPAGGIAGKGPISRMLSAGKIAVGTLQSRQLLGRLDPSVVVGFGGYASVPTMLAATYSSFATAIHEQNALLGRANRLLAPKVKKIATSYKKVKHIPEQAQLKVVYTGMPVRPIVKELRKVPYPKIAEHNSINLLVFGGSQGAGILSQVVPKAINRLDEKLRKRLNLVQQCRKEDFAQLKQNYEQIGVQAEISVFFDDLPERMAHAHLVICRSGASAVAELTTIGRPAILVPYPHAIDDHQSFNAHALDEVGGSWLIPDDAFTSESLSHRLSTLFAMPKSLGNAAHASKRAGQADAAAKLADMVIDLISANGDRLDTRNAA